jgi:hypothetical protein
MSQIPSNTLPGYPRPTTPSLPRPELPGRLPRPELPGPLPRPLPQFPLPMPRPLPLPLPLPFPRPLPQPLPLPLPPGGNIMDRFLTPQRSERMADKQGDQLENIQRGVQDGTVSQQEATRLLEQQARIADAQARASADGVVTGAEAAQIQRMQLRADQSIFQAESTREFGINSPDLATKQIQAAQIGNIAEGIRSGNLTGGEAGSLLRDQSTIARAAGRAESSFGQDPFAKLEVAIRQLHAEYNIRNESTDAQKAPHATRFNFPINLF